MSLLSAVTDFLKPPKPIDPVIGKALDRVGELVDPLLKNAPGFTSQLAPALEHALAYCAGLVDALPGPVDITRRAFANDPLIHALFATADDIDQMLGRSQAVRDYLAEPCSWDGDHFHAMLAARRQQKRQLGMSVEGNVLHNDVPQLVLYFSDHTLVEPACTLETTRAALQQRAFDSLLTTFHDHVEALRAEREGLRADMSVERAHLTVLRGHTSGHAYEVCSRHLGELDARLRATASSLQPDHLLGALAEFLANPESSLRLAPVSITVDRLGIVSDGNPDGSNTHTINFPELTARDKRLHLVMLARISRDEALEAVEKVRDQQHRFMLI